MTPFESPLAIVDVARMRAAFLRMAGAHAEIMGASEVGAAVLRRAPRFHLRLGLLADRSAGGRLDLEAAARPSVRLATAGTDHLERLRRGVGAAWLGGAVLSMMRAADLQALERFLSFDPRPEAALGVDAGAPTAEAFSDPATLAEAIMLEGARCLAAFAAVEPPAVARILSPMLTRLDMSAASPEAELWPRADLCHSVAVQLLTAQTHEDDPE